MTTSIYRLVTVNIIGDEDTNDFTLLGDAMTEFRKKAKKVGAPHGYDRVTLWHAHNDKPWQLVAQCSDDAPESDDPLGYAYRAK